MGSSPRWAALTMTQRSVRSVTASSTSPMRRRRPTQASST